MNKLESTVIYRVKLRSLNILWCVVAICSLILAFTLIAKPRLAVKAPVLSGDLVHFEQSNVNVGTLACGEQGKARFILCNDSSKPVHVAIDHISCRCTSANLDKSIILPRSSAELDATILPSYIQATVSTSVAIKWKYSDTYSNNFVVASIKATYAFPLIPNPTIIDFNFAPGDHELGQREVKLSRGMFPVYDEKMVSAHVASEAVQVSIKQVSINCWNVVLSCDPNKLHQGDSRFELLINVPTSRNEPPTLMSVPVFAHMASDISLDPPSLYFGVVHLLSTSEYKQIRCISNDAQVKIISATCENHNVDCLVRSSSTSIQNAQIICGIRNDDSPGPKQATITITYECKGKHTIQVPVVWYVK